jgi:hypothetical protein
MARLWNFLALNLDLYTTVGEKPKYVIVPIRSWRHSKCICTFPGTGTDRQVLSPLPPSVSHVFSQ